MARVGTLDVSRKRRMPFGDEQSNVSRCPLLNTSSATNFSSGIITWQPTAAGHGKWWKVGYRQVWVVGGMGYVVIVAPDRYGLDEDTDIIRVEPATDRHRLATSLSADQPTTTSPDTSIGGWPNAVIHQKHWGRQPVEEHRVCFAVVGAHHDAAEVSH